MKFFKKMLTSLLIIMSFILCAGCYFIDAQEMKDVKGTYKLTHYTRSYSNPSDGKTVDYIADYGLETYLVVTGTNEGWYVIKNDTTPAYAKPVILSYEYDYENTNQVRYVFYSDSATSTKTRLGVQEDTLTHSTPSIDLGALQQPYSISMTFTKVDDATDLSYATAQLGEMPVYSFGGYRQRGLYYLQERGERLDINAEEYTSKYIYFYLELDTIHEKAWAYYALREDQQPRKEEVDVSPVGDWDGVVLDGQTWTPEWTGSTSFIFSEEVTESSQYALTLALHLWWTDYTQEELEEQLNSDLQAYIDSLPKEEDSSITE